MENEKFPQKILLMLLLCIVFAISLVYMTMKQNMKCDENVVLTDGLEYDCRSVTTFSNGMSTINLCNNKRIVVRTLRIKQITKIK